MAKGYEHGRPQWDTCIITDDHRRLLYISQCQRRTLQTTTQLCLIKLHIFTQKCLTFSSTSDHCRLLGVAEFAGPEIAGLENDGPYHRGGNSRTGIWRSGKWQSGIWQTGKKTDCKLL